MPKKTEKKSKTTVKAYALIQPNGRFALGYGGELPVCWKKRDAKEWVKDDPRMNDCRVVRVTVTADARL